MKVVTLNNQAFAAKCTELAEKIPKNIDLIVGVLGGGGYVVDEIRTEFSSTEIRFAEINREQELKDNVLVRFLLRILPYGVLNTLRVVESKRIKKKLKFIESDDLTQHNVSFDTSGLDTTKVKNILIVDDAIDSGSTMIKVKRKMEAHFQDSKIITAVISWTIHDALLKPDYYLYKNTLVRFPWSKDYK